MPQHYTRLLAEAALEQEARREAQEAQQRERQIQRGAGREEQLAQANGQKQRDAVSAPDADGQQQPAPDLDAEVIDIAKDAGGLVDTPEGPQAQEPRGRKPRRQQTPAAESQKQLAEAAE